MIKNMLFYVKVIQIISSIVSEDRFFLNLKPFYIQINYTYFTLNRTVQM